MPLTTERMMRVVEFARDQSDRIAHLRDSGRVAKQFAQQTDNSQTLKQLIYDLCAIIEQAHIGDPDKTMKFVQEEAHLKHSAKRNKQMAEYMRRYRARETVVENQGSKNEHRLNKSLSLGLGPIETLKPRNPEIDNVTLDFVFERVREAYATLDPGEDYLVADNIRQILRDYNPTDTDVTFWYNKLFEEGLVEKGQFTGEFRPLV